jgi:hypothetical protein
MEESRKTSAAESGEAFPDDDARRSNQSIPAEAGVQPAHPSRLHAAFRHRPAAGRQYAMPKDNANGGAIQRFSRL